VGTASNGPFPGDWREASIIPRKQPLGRKHKAGTGNNSTAPATRIISKTKVTTTADINTKNVVRQVVRDLEKQGLERDEVQEGLFSPVSYFAGGMGICDAEKFWWHEEPGWGCSECPQYRAGVFRINDEFVRATASQRAAFLVRDAHGPALWAHAEATGVGAWVVRLSMCAETSCG